MNDGTHHVSRLIRLVHLVFLLPLYLNRHFTQQNYFQRRRSQFTPPQRNQQHASPRPGATQSFSSGNNNRRSFRSNLNFVGDCRKEVPQTLMDTAKSSSFLNTLTLSPVDLPRLFLILDGVVVQSLWDTGAGRCFISLDVYRKYFSFKKLKPANLTVRSAQGHNCVYKGSVELLVEIRSLKVVWRG